MHCKHTCHAVNAVADWVPSVLRSFHCARLLRAKNLTLAALCPCLVMMSVSRIVTFYSQFVATMIIVKHGRHMAIDCLWVVIID